MTPYTESWAREQFRKCGLPLPPALAIKPPAPIAISGDVTPEGMITALSLTIALKTVSEANRRDWGAHIGRKKRQRTIVRELLRRMSLPALPVKVKMERMGRKLLDADENLPCAFKAIKDGIADAMGRDDADPCYQWSYGQERVKRGYFVRISIETVAVP